MNTQTQTNISVPDQPAVGHQRWYKPSFVDRLRGAFERLPMPYWLTYLLFFILHSLILHILAWSDGWVPIFTFNPILCLFPLWLWGPLAIMTYLDQISLEALHNFRPLLSVHEDTLQRLEYAFSNMPARTVMISSIFWTIFYFLLTYLAFDTFYVAYRVGSLYIVLGILLGVFPFLIGSAIYYHSFRQLFLINRVVKMVKHFSLFQLEPVYVFSGVTARTGVAWIILLSLTLVIFPLQISTIPTLVMLVSQVFLAIAAFVLPLWIVNQRLVAEKRGLLAEVNKRMESLLSQLHHKIDENKLEELNRLNDAISSLSAEREVISKIPTWPWRAGTLTSFTTAILLPIILFIIQVVLGRWLGG
jgi:hypothetical protein